MSDTQAFDPSTLKPGDEVGIDRCRSGEWVSCSTTRVVAIHAADRLIELEGDEWYWLDGRHVSRVVKLRLGYPTDEGRLARLRETASEDLRTLGGLAYEMDMPALRRLKAWIDAKGWDA